MLSKINYKLSKFLVRYYKFLNLTNLDRYQHHVNHVKAYEETV